MPSGKTHDAITLILALPVFAGSYLITSGLLAAAITTIGFLFGGLMFGPDLDTGSKQYWRWALFRPIWLPYRALFRHRSRFTHGLLFGPFIRMIYFQAMLAAIFIAGVYVHGLVSGGHTPGWEDLLQTWKGLSTLAYRWFGPNALLLCFIGMWLGAASHTAADRLL